METFLLWLGFIAFVAATALFIYPGNHTAQGERTFHVITAMITGMAAFSYLITATGAGATLVEGVRVFYFSGT